MQPKTGTIRLLTSAAAIESLVGRHHQGSGSEFLAFAFGRGSATRKRVFESEKMETKRQCLIEEKNCVQHLAQRLDGFAGQVNFERLSATLQPHSLHEHEKAADMIRMEVRKKNGIDCVVTETTRLVAPIHGFTTINKNCSLAEAIKKRCVIAVGAGGARGGAETFY